MADGQPPASSTLQRLEALTTRHKAPPAKKAAPFTKATDGALLFSKTVPNYRLDGRNIQHRFLDSEAREDQSRRQRERAELTSRQPRPFPRPIRKTRLRRQLEADARELAA
eukprot:g5201.t1